MAPGMDIEMILDNSINMLIGKSEEGVYFDGIMDDIRVYENPLNATDVNTIYAQYYQPGNDGASALMDSSFELSGVTTTLNSSSEPYTVTLNATSPSNVYWKAICIADHNYNSREIIENIVNNSSLSSALFTNPLSTSLSSVTLSNVVVINESTPDLTFEVNLTSKEVETVSNTIDLVQ